jgi:vacuolar-type H+-ATPase subunit D/Vma8
LVARLELARHASDLLHSKEEALERERVRLQGHATRAEAQWQQLYTAAGSWLVKARMLGASDEVAMLIAHGSPSASITPRWQTSMGIAYPGSVECAPGSTPTLTSTAALGPTLAAYRAALDAAATHAAASAAVSRLDTELANTRRRRRAIDERLRPQLEEALRQLDLSLDELDREEALRVRIAVDHKALAERKGAQP